MLIETDRIVAYFQPIIDLKEEGKSKKYESLLRYPVISSDGKETYRFPWDERSFDKLKEKYPDKYFTYTKKMLMHVIKKLQKYDDVEISLNICFVDIETEERRDELLKIIQESNVGRRLVLEITEESELKDKEIVKNFMKEAKENYGCKFSLDDFGKGYATFDPLLSFDFDYLKLDKVLVENFTIEPKKFYILDMLIDLSKRINIKVIAEYIEKEEEYKSMMFIGCDYGQGFYLGKPNKELVESP